MPLPWARCHCGALAEYLDEGGQSWCGPCLYGVNPDCACSKPSWKDVEQWWQATEGDPKA